MIDVFLRISILDEKIIHEGNRSGNVILALNFLNSFLKLTYQIVNVEIVQDTREYQLV